MSNYDISKFDFRKARERGLSPSIVEMNLRSDYCWIRIYDY
jgi:hypothetical protein